MAAAAPAGAATPPALTSRPLFTGYTLLALVAIWLAGIALRSAGPLAVLPPALWLVLAGGCAALWLGVVFVGRRAAGGSASQAWRVLLVASMLGCWLALGAARAASADPASAPRAINRLVVAGANVHARGAVAAEPVPLTSGRLLTVDVAAVSLDGGHTWRPATGRVEAVIGGPDDWFAPAYGDTVALAGTFNPAAGGYVPPGVLARLSLARATVLARGGGNPLLAWLFDLRVRLAQTIQRSLPEPEAALLIGILLGLKTPTLRARLALFTSTGTIHLVVPAGLKVATLAELATYAARPLGRWPRAVAALLAVGVYAALGGGGSAAVRAAVMGALLALAPALGRAYNVFTALAVAVLVMTAVEPLVIYDAGFQLTTLATLGLPLLVPPIQRRLVVLLGRLPAAGIIAELLAVTLAAQIATLPVLALTFHLVSLVAPLANLLTVPLLAPVLALGGLLAFAGLLGGPLAGVLALALGWVLWPLLWFMDGVIALAAALPAASLAVPDVPVLLAWMYYAALVGLVAWALRRRARHPAGRSPTRTHGAPAGHVRLSRGLLAGLLALALLGATGAAAPTLARGTARLDFLNVGPGGEAMLLRLPSGVTALLDGGPSGPALEAALAGRLPFWQHSLDLALLTDPRPGDARGLEDAAAHFSIGHAADAGMAHPDTEYLAWLDAARAAGATHTLVRAGNVIHLAPDTSLRVLAPPPQLYPPNEGDTVASDDAILRLETPGLHVLFLSGADDYALDALAYSGQPLAADVVEVALPAGVPLDASTPLVNVLRLAHPKLVVITSAPIPPATAVREAAATAPWTSDGDAAGAPGALIYRVDTAGTITLSGGASGWSLGG